MQRFIVWLLLGLGLSSLLLNAEVVALDFDFGKDNLDDCLVVLTPIPKVLVKTTKRLETRGWHLGVKERRLSRYNNRLSRPNA